MMLEASLEVAPAIAFSLSGSPSGLVVVILLVSALIRPIVWHDALNATLNNWKKIHLTVGCETEVPQYLGLHSPHTPASHFSCSTAYQWSERPRDKCQINQSQSAEALVPVASRYKKVTAPSRSSDFFQHNCSSTIHPQTSLSNHPHIHDRKIHLTSRLATLASQANPSQIAKMPPKAADKKPASKAPATASKAPEKKDAGKKTAASGDKKKRTKARKETYSSYIYKGESLRVSWPFGAFLPALDTDVA